MIPVPQIAVLVHVIQWWLWQPVEFFSCEDTLSLTVCEGKTYVFRRSETTNRYHSDNIISTKPTLYVASFDFNRLELRFVMYRGNIPITRQVYVDRSMLMYRMDVQDYLHIHSGCRSLIQYLVETTEWNV